MERASRRWPRTTLIAFGGYRWLTDAPEAETHLLRSFHRLTRTGAASQGTAVRLRYSMTH